MPFARTLDFFIDTAKPGGLACLLEGTSGAARLGTVSVIQGDDFTVRLFFRTVANGAYAATTPVSLDSGAEIILAGKEDPDDESLLFSASGFSAGTDATLGAYYSARLALTTSELEAALAAAADTLTVLVDVKVQNPDNSRRLSFRFELAVLQQVYDGETDPVPAEPSYPSPSAIMLKNPPGGNYRFKDGNFQLWNPDTEKFHTIFPTGAEGSVAITWGPGEDA